MQARLRPVRKRTTIRACAGAFVRAFVGAFVAVGAFLGPGPAAAETWVVDPDASRIDIVYEINGKPWEGAFTRFSGAGAFDPDDIETAGMRLEIETESIDVGNVFGTAVAKTTDWLSVEAHPTAVFELTSLTPLADGRYRMAGALTLRGRTHEVAGEIALETGAAARSTGETRFDRSLFGVGVGFTALFVTIGDMISVRFDIVARRAAEGEGG